ARNQTDVRAAILREIRVERLVLPANARERAADGPTVGEEVHGDPLARSAGADRGADDPAMVRVALRDAAAPVPLAELPHAEALARLEARELRLEAEAPLAERTDVLQTDRVSPAVLRQLHEIPEGAGLLVSPPLSVDLEAGAREDPAGEHAEELVRAPGQQRVAGLGRGSADVAEDVERGVDRERAARGEDRAGEPDAQPGVERRRQRHHETAQGAVVVGGVEVEVVRFGKPPEHPPEAEVAERRVDRRGGLHEEMGDSG